MNAFGPLLTRLPPDLFFFVALVFGVIQLVITVMLALAVKTDAEQRVQPKGELFLIPPNFWAVIVFMTGGYPGAVVYWLVHYSSLRPGRAARD